MLGSPGLQAVEAQPFPAGAESASSVAGAEQEHRGLLPALHRGTFY